MNDPVSKIYRYLRREYPATASFSATTVCIGLLAGSVAAVASGAPFLLCTVAGGAFGLTGIPFSMAMGGEDDRSSCNDITLNGFRLVGPIRAINSIRMTQKLVESVTSKCRHLIELPPRLQKKIENHIADIQSALAQVRVYDASGSPAQVQDFAFQRAYVDAMGQDAVQQFAAIPGAQPLPVAAVSVAAASLPLPEGKAAAAFDVAVTSEKDSLSVRSDSKPAGPAL